MEWKEFELKQENAKPLEIQTILSGILSPASLDFLSEEEKERNENRYSMLRANRLFKKLNHRNYMFLLKVIGSIRKHSKKYKFLWTNHSRRKLKRRRYK